MIYLMYDIGLQLGQAASAVRSSSSSGRPSEPPAGVRQVSEPAQLDRYQSLVEQCGRPSPPAGTSPSRTTTAGTAKPAARTAAEPAAGAAAKLAAEAAAEPAVDTDAADPAPEPEFADAESGEPPLANGGAAPAAANGPLLTSPGAEAGMTSPGAEAEVTVPVTWFGGEEAAAVRRSAPR